MNRSEIKELLDQKAEEYNNLFFIESDPIQIPHSFTKKEDIEISGLLTAMISWGRRDMIIRSAKEMMNRMGNDPFHFVMNARRSEIDGLTSFTYRTFQQTDLAEIVLMLRTIYQNSGLEAVFTKGFQKGGAFEAIAYFREQMLAQPHSARVLKHLPNPHKNSACKRIHMYLRWMVRQDNKEVDFGLWKDISPAQLSIPLDVHTAKVSRYLGILHRKQNDRKSVEEIDRVLRELNPQDPVLYDFALFGLSMFDGLTKHTSKT